MTWSYRQKPLKILPDIQPGFRKGRGTRDQIVNIHWIIEKAREFQKKYLLLLYWICQRIWLCGSQQTVENSARDGNTRPPYLSIGSPWWTQVVKRLPAMRETRVRSLGQEDSLEKEMATHSSILAWRILWTEKPGRLQSTGSQRVGHDWVISFHFTSLHFKITADGDCSHEIPDVQAGFRKGRGTRVHIANTCWIIEKAREFQKKYLLLPYWLHQCLWLCGLQ